MNPQPKSTHNSNYENKGVFAPIPFEMLCHKGLSPCFIKLNITLNMKGVSTFWD